MKALVSQKWKNTPEAASYLGLRPGTLEVWRSLGRGPRYRKFGRRVMYATFDLDSYAATHIIETCDTVGTPRGDDDE